MIGSVSRTIVDLITGVNRPTPIRQSYTAHVSARDTRAQMLRRLIETRFGGNASALARALKRSPAQIYQYLHGHVKIGDAFARHVETTIPGLWPGYMDGKPAHTAALESVAAGVPKKVADAVSDLIEVAEREPREAERIAAVIEILIKQSDSEPEGSEPDDETPAP